MWSVKVDSSMAAGTDYYVSFFRHGSCSNYVGTIRPIVSGPKGNNCYTADGVRFMSLAVRLDDPF